MSEKRKKAAGRSYSTSVERPSKDRPVSLRGLLALVLTLLVPPLGLLVMWGLGIFRARGRTVLTTLATVEMALLLVLLWPRPEMAVSLPATSVPAAVTAAPEDESLDALYNIEQLIYQQQLAEVIAKGGTERDLMTEEEKLEESNSANEAVLNTTVYSVFHGAKRYHASKVCQHQTNGRELTVREAMKESLAPCPICNPPVPTA